MPQLVWPLEYASRDALFDSFLRQEALNVGAELPAILSRRICSITLVLTIDLALLVARVEIARPALRHQDRRVALVAKLALERVPQLTTPRIGARYTHQQAIRGAKRRPDRV